MFLSPMKLENASTLMISESFPPQVGGVARSACRNAVMQADMQKRIDIFTIDRSLPPGFTRQGETEGLTVSSLGPFGEDDLTLQLAGSIISHLGSLNAYDIYQGFYALHPGYLAVFYGRLLGKKTLVNIRGNDLDRGMFHYRYQPLLLWTLAHADAISCVSRELADKCRALTGRNDIFYTPNSVDGTIFRDLPRDIRLASCHGIDNELILGVFGELRMKKGITFILEAFSDLIRERPAKLLIVGRIRSHDRPYFDNFLHQHKGLEEHIVVLDYTQDRDELCRLYNLVDIVLSPSLWEGMPNTVLEAMACGRIVISSDAGGARDIISHGLDGYLLPVPELHRLKEAILEVLQWDSSRKKQAGERARHKVLTEFSPVQEREGIHRALSHLLNEK
jgi:L-malate glycosyltransferase